MLAASLPTGNPAVLAANLPAREWKLLKGIDIAGHACEYEGEVRDDNMPDGYGRIWWVSEDCWYRGHLKSGFIHGEGMFAMRNGDRFHGTFWEDRPLGTGILATSDGRRMLVEYPARMALFDQMIPAPATSRPHKEYVIEQVRRIYTAACVRAGDGAKENDYGHMKSFHGKVVFAFPFRANRPLVNAKHVRGKIVVVQRGGCPFTTKVMNVQDAGAIGMIIVGRDNKDRFNEVLQIVQGRTSQLLRVHIPVMYVLGRDEEHLHHGMLCRVTFLPRTPRTPDCWLLGSIDVPEQTCYPDESELSSSNLLEVCLSGLVNFQVWVAPSMSL